MDQVREQFASVEMPREYERFYNDRVNSFLYRLEQDYEGKVSDQALSFSKSVGQILFAGYVHELCEEDSLEYMGYEFLGEYDTKNFEATIGENQELINKILQGDVFVGYKNDFSTIILTSIGTDAMRQTHMYVN